MTMLYSKTAQYAIQAMLFLAENANRGYFGIRTIAEECKIPEPSLGHLVPRLIRHRLVKSQRGIGGGVQLASPAEEISLLEIVSVMDGPQLEQTECVIGLDRCSNEAICPLHEEWVHIRDLIQETLIHQSLSDLVAGLHTRRRSSERARSTEEPALLT